MEAYPKINAAIAAGGATAAGRAYSRYHNEDMSMFDVEAGAPFT